MCDYNNRERRGYNFKFTRPKSLHLHDKTKMVKDEAFQTKHGLGARGSRLMHIQLFTIS